MLDKIKGCIVGGAIGDALGYPAEFISSRYEIEKKYGPGGITDYDLKHSWSNSKFDKAQISDDTQMTLYTFEALMKGAEDVEQIITNVTDAYLVWMGFQTGETVNTKNHYKTAEFPELNRRRAPGNTCLTSLLSINKGVLPVNDSKGCGGIMRIAPVAVYGFVKGLTLEQTAELAGEIAEITHLHPLSTYSSAACTALIQLCLKESDVDTEKFVGLVRKSMDITKKLYGDSNDMNFFETYIRDTIEFIGRPEPDWQLIEQRIGEGWVAEESFAIAVFCVARHIDNVRQCVISAVNHGGDSDSTGAIAGNIIGSLLGYNAIPENYRDKLQNIDFIEELCTEILQK